MDEELGGSAVKLKVGQTIEWMDNYGRGPPYQAKITKIMTARAVGQKQEYECEEAQLVDSDWEHLQGREVIIIVDNDHWLFAWQIDGERELPIKDELCSGCKTPLPPRFQGTGWDYVDGKPLCNGCRRELERPERRKEEEN